MSNFIVASATSTEDTDDAGFGKCQPKKSSVNALTAHSGAPITGLIERDHLIMYKLGALGWSMAEK
jgi:hypothetical protein